MNEQEKTGWQEDDSILPDGWKEGDDLFEQPAADRTAAETPQTVSVDTDPAPAPPQAEAEPPAKPSPEEERLARDVKTARQLYPELRELPEEVLMAVAKGDNFLSAYAVYRAQHSLREAERLRRENEALRQNQASASRAPVRGVTGGGSAVSRPVSDFERGFDADGW